MSGGADSISRLTGQITRASGPDHAHHGHDGGSAPTPDCGLRTRSWDVAYRKLQHMVEGTRMAKEQLGL
jgi:hypothetical protein